MLKQMAGGLGDLVALGVATECAACKHARALVGKVNDLPEGVYLVADAVQPDGGAVAEGKYFVTGHVRIACASCGGVGLLATAKGRSLVEYVRQLVLDAETAPDKPATA